MEFDVVARSLVSCIPTSDVEIVSTGAIHIAKVHGDIATGQVLCSVSSPDFSCFAQTDVSSFIDASVSGMQDRVFGKSNAFVVVQLWFGAQYGLVGVHNSG